MDDRVAKAGYETVNSMLENIQKLRNIEFTEAQTKAIAENIAIAWSIVTGKQIGRSHV